MKKVFLSILATSVILSSCSRSEMVDNLEPTDSTSLEALAANDVSKLSDKEIEKIVLDNQKDIEKTAKQIFQSRFADDTEVDSYKNDLITPEFKGGVIFNILNRSDIAKKIVYGLSKIIVKKKFAKPGTVDNLARINDSQANELLAKLKPGDLILCGNDSSFVHAIVYEGNGIIIHSLASQNPKFWGVVKEPLKTYFARSERDKIVALRAKNATPDDIKKELEFANKQIGKPYDSLFLMNSDNAFYCTELAFRSITSMTNKPRIYPHKVKLGWEMIENEDFMDSPDLETIWTLGRERAPIAKLHSY
ncbi:MAG: YiiX/YebB-like N1pC/P60 family cysteine hydrolase [Candidatus Sericytochromatia bacterium]